MKNFKQGDSVVREWCYYTDEATSITLAVWEANKEAVVEYKDDMTPHERSLLAHCKGELGINWNTGYVGDDLPFGFTPMGESAPNTLKSLVTESEALFEELTGISTAKIDVRYGIIDDKKVIGACRLNGFDMVLDIDKLSDVSDKFVKAVVFHELGHCLMELEHINNPDHIMNESITPKTVDQPITQWVSDMNKMVR